LMDQVPETVQYLLQAGMLVCVLSCYGYPL